jgi:serine/threonine protein kinase
VTARGNVTVSGLSRAKSGRARRRGRKSSVLLPRRTQLGGAVGRPDAVFLLPFPDLWCGSHEQAECDWATGLHGLPPPIPAVASCRSVDCRHGDGEEGCWRGLPRLSPLLREQSREYHVSSALTSFSASYNEVPAGNSNAAGQTEAGGWAQARRARSEARVATVVHGRHGQRCGVARGDSSELEEVDALGPGERRAGAGRRAGSHDTDVDKGVDGKWGGEGEQMEWQQRVVGEPRIIGNGTFGVVYAVQLDDGETVAIKRVLQDPRYRNRELAIMKQLQHPNIVTLKHYYHARTHAHAQGQGGREDKAEGWLRCQGCEANATAAQRGGDVYLYLVMEYLPSTLHKAVQMAASAGRVLPLLSTKIISWQVLRALAYMHRHTICHRDLKPHNILLDSQTLVAKLCDMGSAKKLRAGSTSIAYICSRLYRSPELIMGATEYTTAIDMWSFGCVLAEMLLSRPLFPADDSPRQMVSIARVLGAPDGSSVAGMKVKMSHRALQAARDFSAHVEGWEILRKHKTPLEAADLLSQLLVYRPQRRLTAMEALAHPFFDSLREIEAAGTGGWHGNTRVPALFDFTDEEIEEAREVKLLEHILPPHELALLQFRDGSPVTSVATPTREGSPASDAQRESEGERRGGSG